MKRIKQLACILLTVCLAAGFLPGFLLPGSTTVQAGWVDWNALLNESGWYDEDQGAKEETEKNQQEQKSKKKNKKNKKNKNSKNNKNNKNKENQDKENQQISSGKETTEDQKEDAGSTSAAEGIQVDEDGIYTSKEEVAAYLHEFDHLPDNYITKNEAKKLGWVSSEGNLDEVAPGKSIGGDRFGNYEGSLPDKKNRTYYECDIDYEGGFRGSKRIIYSSDGLIYYTEDHYTTFELLYE